MKSIKPLLLFCGGLMAAASLMGTIDYSKASKSGELKNLYKDDEVPLAAIPLLNKDQLRTPVPPSLGSFSRAPIREQNYTEAEYRAELKAANEENDKLYKDRRARAKTTARISNKKKMQPPPEINFGSFSRGDLRKRIYVESKDEEVFKR